MEALSLLFAGQGSVVNGAFLVCLFWVLLFKPQRIRNLALFKGACWMFALSVLTPTLIALYFGGITATTGMRPVAVASDPIRMYVAAIPPVLFFISFLCAVNSIIPTSNSPDA